MACVDDRRQRLIGSDEELRDLLDRSLGGRQTDPLGSLPDERIEPGEREREVATPLVARHRVDLVHDHRPHRPQHLAGAFGREDEVERFRRRDEDVGWATEHRLPLRLRRVPGPDKRPHLDVG